MITMVCAAGSVHVFQPCDESHRLLHDNHGLRGKISSRISTFNVHARLEQAHCRRITDV